MTVSQIQHLLAYLGFYTVPVDGIAGAATAKAVRDFQQAFGGLQADGIAGAQTQNALRQAVSSGMPLREEADFWAGIQYFQRAEFACPCPRCGGFPAEPEEALVKLADRVRGHFGKPATVSSGVRCTAHNREVGGAANSRHLRGKAMDFRVSGFSAADVLAYVSSQPETRYAYAIDRDYIHMDIQ